MHILHVDPDYSGQSLVKTALEKGLEGLELIQATDLGSAFAADGTSPVQILISDIEAIKAADLRKFAAARRKHFHFPHYVLCGPEQSDCALHAVLAAADRCFCKSSVGMHELVAAIHAHQNDPTPKKEDSDLDRLEPDSDRYRLFFQNSPIGFVEIELTDLITRFDRLRANGIRDLTKYLAKYPTEIISLANGIQVIDANLQSMKMYGVDRKDLLFGPIGRLLSPSSIPRLLDGLISTWNNDEKFQAELDLVRFDGSSMPVLFSFQNRINVAAARIRSFCSLAMIDLTKQTQLRREVEDSEVRFKSLSNASFEALFFSKSGVCLDQNKTAEKMFGYSRDEAVGKMGTEWIVEADRALVLRKMLSGSERPYEATALRKDGSSFPAEIQARMAQKNGDQPIRITALRDISKRVEAQESNQFFSEVLNHSPNEILILESGNLSIIGANASARRNLKFDNGDLISTPLAEIFLPEGGQDLHDLAQILRKDKGRVELIRGHMKRSDHSSYPVEVHLQCMRRPPHAYTVVMIDISDRLAAQQQQDRMKMRLQEAQKMESLGILAGGVAHDFNNILMTIMGNADLAQISLQENSPVQPNLNEITKACRRAGELAKQMLAYSGKGAFIIESLDLDHLIDGLSQLLAASISKNSTIRLNLNGQLPSIRGDATQIRQVIMNLITNASEAYAETPGTIDISTGVQALNAEEILSLADPFPAELMHDSKPGNYVYLGVKDSGCGMKPDVIARIFDPFFSTKFIGRGLGMSAVLGILRGHKGFIEIESKVGKGTQFKIFLPAQVQNGDSGIAARSINQDQQSSDTDWAKGKTILVIDDEADILNIASEILRHLGFHTLTADGGAKALEILQNGQTRVDLALLDLTMPGLNGFQTFTGLKALRPDLPVVLCSGYSESEATIHFPKDQLDGFLQKPFGVNKLNALLKTMQGKL